MFVFVYYMLWNFHYLQVYFIKVALISLDKHRLTMRQSIHQLLKKAYVEAVVEGHVRKTSIFFLYITSLVVITWYRPLFCGDASLIPFALDKLKLSIIDYFSNSPWTKWYLSPMLRDGEWDPEFNLAWVCVS